MANGLGERRRSISASTLPPQSAGKTFVRMSTGWPVAEVRLGHTKHHASHGHSVSHMGVDWSRHLYANGPIQFKSFEGNGIGRRLLDGGALRSATVRLFFNSTCALIWASTCSTKCGARRARMVAGWRFPL
jgi:hypothetical protein